MNLAIVIGNLGETPVVRKTAAGMSVTTFSLATTERWKKDGVKQEKTTWHKIQAWGTNADNCAAYLSKGSKLQVTGRMEIQPWTDQQGIKRNPTIIVMSEMEMLGDPGHRNESNNSTPAQNTATTNSACKFTYKQMKDGGWTDEQLLADPQYAHLVPKKAAPPAPPKPPVAQNNPPSPPTPISVAPPQGCASSQGFVPDEDYGV
jgi:single-strand DNA-binding protein